MNPERTGIIAAISAVQDAAARVDISGLDTASDKHLADIVVTLAGAGQHVTHKANQISDRMVREFLTKKPRAAKNE